MKRSPFKRRAGTKTLKPKSAAEKRKKTMRARLLGKPVVPRMGKGPARDEAHLAKVRGAPCAICVLSMRNPLAPSEAHHVRCVSPRTMGKRVSDYLTIALCREHHAALHMRGDEAAWWFEHYANPGIWIANFSPEGKAALAALEAAASGKG